jgi:hypothetical protein
MKDITNKLRSLDLYVANYGVICKKSGNKPSDVVLKDIERTIESIRKETIKLNKR